MVILVSASGSRPLNAELRESLQLRAMRASPPGRASKGERRKVFCTALEQSEQLLNAAAQTPADVRPMLVFYGLAQGVRALFACAPGIPDRDFRTKGHGLRERNLRGSLRSISVETTGRGMFAVLCQLFDFTEFEAPVTFEQLWAANPHLFQRRLAGSEQPPSVTAGCMLDHTIDSEMAVMTLGSLGSEVGDRLLTRSDVADYVRSTYGPYPFDVFPLEERSKFLFKYPREPWVDLSVSVSRDQHEMAVAYLDARQARVGYNTWILPRIGGVLPKPNALVLWWALFFSLSIRARYEPEGWTKDLDLDSSPVAVQLQDVLDDAPSRCHALLLEAIKEVCS
ncbi:YaaC family protein [Microlunatus antarcticus]|uniref:YaaC-like Protein n=1 Tax=Microlunatus antarcticus TaxID=53388 RepID=A0A7W5P6Z4_9ACTN|nr:YaaC family protein [Microlunatus antarcticus]MBB3326361.1 hypothetical protein [Microlunatus antarcticus]